MSNYNGSHHRAHRAHRAHRGLPRTLLPYFPLDLVVLFTFLSLFALLTAPSLVAQPMRLLRASDNDTLPVKPPTSVIKYGTDSLQFGELRLPEGRGPFPVAIVIHGGCWVARFASLRNSAPLADALRDAGIATWNIEYRRSDHPGGGWPGTFTDAADAAEHLRLIARDHPIDLTRVITIGHSAGGHLALWLAGIAKVPATSPIHRSDPITLRGAIALAGIVDLADFRTYSSSSCGPVIDPLMGGTPDEHPDRYRAASPVALFPLPVPQVQIVGSLDRVMPERARNAHLAAADSTKSPMELVVLEGMGHHEPMSPRTAAFREILQHARRLLAGP